MKITIHRGTHQIGGNCVEVSTGSTRLILDVGPDYRLPTSCFLSSRYLVTLRTMLDKPKPTLERLRPALVAFGRSHPMIQRIALFGSVARGESNPSSDVDVVVEFVPGSVPRGMAGFAFLDDFERELSSDLDIPVHLITSGSVRMAAKAGNRSLSRAVERDSRVVYEAESAAA